MEKYGVVTQNTNEELVKQAGPPICPRCGAELTDSNPPVCPNCGSLPFEKETEDDQEEKETEDR